MQRRPRAPITGLRAIRLAVTNLGSGFDLQRSWAVGSLSLYLRLKDAPTLGARGVAGTSSRMGPQVLAYCTLRPEEALKRGPLDAT